jgi:hypothetical protein
MFIERGCLPEEEKTVITIATLYGLWLPQPRPPEDR